MKIAALAASGWVILLAGCGLAANPQPPTLWLPKPVRDLRAARVGNKVQLSWTMPRHTTDNVELTRPQRAEICWMNPKGNQAAFSAASCQTVGNASFEPDKPAEFAAPLPADLAEGAPRAIVFFVELESPAGKSAGPSNPAWVATGAAPPPVTGLRLQAVPEGVAVRWEKAEPGPELIMRMDRTLVVSPKAPKPGDMNGAPPPQEQTLEVDLSHSDPGGALDRNAVLDHTYRYSVQRVRRVSPDGRMLEIAGLPSQPTSIDARDVFPPAVPAGLAAVVDEEAHAIDLSWRPDTDPDLAGYVVYRRDLKAGTIWERISGKAPLVPPSFDDHQVLAGQRYAYAVSAVDEDGNESARSAPLVEELAQR